MANSFPASGLAYADQFAVNRTSATGLLNTFLSGDLNCIQIRAETDTSAAVSYLGMAPSILEYYRNAQTSVNLIIQTKIQFAGDGGNIVFSPNSPSADLTPIERMRITKCGHVIIGGTVSQNNAANRGNLTINGTTSILNLSTSDTNAGYLYHGGTDMLLVNAKNGASLFYTNDNERMRITSVGNVGIGTTSPGSILHIKGPSDSGCPFGAELRVWENSFGAVVQGSTIGTTYAFFGNFRYNFNNATGSDAPYSLSAGGMLVKDGIHIFTSSPNTSTFTPSERLTINNNGNVGIGCTVPATALTVAASGANGLLLDQGLADNTTSARMFFRTNASAYAMFADANGLNFMTGSAVGSTSGTSRMILSNGGNVGIGTTSPSYKLQSDANAASTCTDSIVAQNSGVSSIGHTVGIRFRFNTAEPAAIRTVLENAGTGNARLGLFVSTDNSGANLTERLSINCNGRVGIGTTTPSYLLHVNGTFYAAGSSIDYKEEIATYDTDSCLFMCLKPKTYQYKDEWKHLGKELKSETQIGLIAEEVAEVMPELAVLVNEDDNKVVRNVDYEKLSIVLLNEVQKLRREVDSLKK